MKLYAERDAIRQGQHYVRHVEAMTAEGLHSKADIAAELAHRDILIESLRSTIDDLTAGEIHTCHDHCQRTACILRRENDALRSRLAIESKEREGREALLRENESLRARLAEAESRLNLADAEITMLRHFNAEADALLREIAGHRPAVAFFAPQLAGVIAALDRIDAFLAPTSASVVEITHE